MDDLTKRPANGASRGSWSVPWSLASCELGGEEEEAGRLGQGTAEGETEASRHHQM